MDSLKKKRFRNQITASYLSWSQVKIDGIWYHLDCELEDGIARNDGNVSYRYFLRSDSIMSASHFWSQRLIDLGRLKPGQVEEVRAHYMGENCPQDHPTPSPSYILVNPQPDIDGLREKLDTERTDYEVRYGKLEYIELDILPPVFVRYYYRDGDPPEDATENVRNYRHPGGHRRAYPGASRMRWVTGKALLPVVAMLLAPGLILLGTGTAITGSMPHWRDSVGDINHTEKITGRVLVQQSAAQEDKLDVIFLAFVYLTLFVDAIM